MTDVSLLLNFLEHPIQLVASFSLTMVEPQVAPDASAAAGGYTCRK
jgi:hypothetical protein